MAKQIIEDWEKYYRDEDPEKMPWYYAQLDHDVAEALDRFAIAPCAALDLGTGPGTQAMALAGMGFTVTGTDISQSAVRKASAKAGEKGVAVEFATHDILSGPLDKSFGMVFDRGCFHIINHEDRAVYADNVAAMIGTGGYLLLKCFSHKQPGDEGPHRITPEEIEQSFSGKFEIVEIKDSDFHGTLDSGPHKALFCVLRVA